MKKLSYLFVLLFCLSFVSCEPNSISEDEETNEIYNVDRTKIRKPGTNGSGD